MQYFTCIVLFISLSFSAIWHLFGIIMSFPLLHSNVQMKESTIVTADRTFKIELKVFWSLDLQLYDNDSYSSFFYLNSTALETDLRIEREWRGNLQKNLESEKTKITHLQKELHVLRNTKEEYEMLQKQFQQLKAQCEEQEKTLAELGSHLSESVFCFVFIYA